MSHKGLNSMNWRMRASVLAAGAVALAAVSLPAAASGGPSLGSARNYAVLAGSTVASTGLTAITGDVGVSPGTAITGFPPATVTTGALHEGDTAAAAAHADASLAYAFLKGMPSIPANNLTGTNLGGLTLAPGVYTFNTSAQLTGDLTLDAGGASDALFVFQIGSTLTTASNAHVSVINGGANYDESNVFWQVGSSATLGSGTAFKGNVLAYASITLVTGASMVGDALALNGGVTMESNSVTSPPLVGPILPPPGAPAAPSNTTTASFVVQSGAGFNVTWTDSSVNETGFRVFRRDGAAADFVEVGSVVTTNMAGTGGVMNFQDQVTDPSASYTYRVTAYSLTQGQSAPSNESRVDVVASTPTRKIDLRLGRGRSAIRDRNRINTDSVFISESYTVIDALTLLPVVPTDVDPRVNGVTIQIRAPGNVRLVAIPANDPRWKASKKGVYTWKSHDGRHAPVTILRIDTRKSLFTLKSDHNEFGAVPVNNITVSFVYLTATGSDTRVWMHPKHMPRGYRALFTLPK
jgi:hypothetical protein